MKLFYISSLILFFCACASSKMNNFEKCAYSDLIHHLRITDDFRCFEDLSNMEIKKWHHEQDSLTNEIFDQIEGLNDLTKLINSLSSHIQNQAELVQKNRDGSYFFVRHSKGKSSQLFYRNVDEKEELLLDAAGNDDGYFINYLKTSPDQKFMVIGFSTDDAESSTLRVWSVTDKKMLPLRGPNSVPNSMGGVTWTHDGSGFFYTYLPHMKDEGVNKFLYSELMFADITNNEINTIVSRQDREKLEMEEDLFVIAIDILKISGKETLLYVHATSDRYYQYFLSEFSNNRLESTTQVATIKDKIVYPIRCDTENFYFLSAKRNSNHELCSTPVKNPDFSAPNVLIGYEDELITDFALANGEIFFVENENGILASVKSVSQDTIKDISLPQPAGSITLESSGHNLNDLRINISGWLTKEAKYEYDFSSKQFLQSHFSIDDPSLQFVSNYQVKEVLVKSHDGEMVPLSIVSKKGTKLDKTNPILLGAYGANKFIMRPTLYQYIIPWLENGGGYAIAHIRGGGEKGDSWHQAGIKTQKRNAWQDFIACAEYLIHSKYTTADKMVAWTASAGGIAVGRAIVERPDLFKAAVFRSSVLNPIRVESYKKTTIGEYGTTKNYNEFHAFLENDPYLNLKENVSYPSVYIVHGMNDLRVPIWEATKFAAKLKYMTKTKSPILIDIDYEGGHGFEISQEKKDRETARFIAYALWQTGQPDFQLQ